MGLLSDVRAYLQRVQTGETTTLAERNPIDRNSLRRKIFDAVSLDDPRTRDLIVSTDDLITELAQTILDTPEISRSQEPQSLLSTALDYIVRTEFDPPPDRSTITVTAQASLLSPLFEQVCKSAWQRYYHRQTWKLPSPRLYALELGLVQVVDARPHLTMLGRSFLRFTGSETIRWIIAIELLSSVDHDDPWRAHPSFAEFILGHRTVSTHYDFSTFGTHFSNPALPRWADMGLLDVQSLWPSASETPPRQSYTLTDLGMEILTEALQEPDIPLKSAVRAILDDSRDQALGIPHPSGTGAAASVVRHTRMLAHEMRNALVPVRIQFEQLWQRLPRDSVRVALHRHHQKILAGLDRALQFVTDAARAVDLSEDGASLFNLATVLREVANDIQRSDAMTISIDIAPTTEVVHILGPRARLLLAIVNLLRNAIQAGGPATRIRARLTAAEGHMIVLTIDDSGPGVPEALRDKLFMNGHSGHEHGTGHGLALVREVVEEDFTGSVHHEVSDLGGARFILRFPIPSEAA